MDGTAVSFVVLSVVFVLFNVAATALMVDRRDIFPLKVRDSPSSQPRGFRSGACAVRRPARDGQPADFATTTAGPRRAVARCNELHHGVLLCDAVGEERGR